MSNFTEEEKEVYKEVIKEGLKRVKKNTEVDIVSTGGDAQEKSIRKLDILEDVKKKLAA